jgi:predicted short-subunit dehydrogenase-like oxidoreductase (DUF2520 family)
MQTIAIIGKSKVGESLAKAIRTSSKYKLSAIVSARATVYPKLDADVLIIAVKDDAIEEVSRKAINTSGGHLRLIVHLSGSRPSTILPPRGSIMRLTLHPIQTFPKPDADLFRGIHWMASSDDLLAIRWARQFAADLGGKGVIPLSTEALPLYHAMTVFAANFLTLLGGAIEEISDALGQDPKKMKAALRPLMENSLKNVLAKPAKEALTGPIVRKDFETIRKHQKALKTIDPNLKKIYDAFLKFGLRMIE